MAALGLEEEEDWAGETRNCWTLLKKRESSVSLDLVEEGLLAEV
jgi:hypothetical protein